jgi:adenine-specific DNA-methyltransferase
VGQNTGDEHLSVSESANLADILLNLVPRDGSSIGNGRLRESLSKRIGREISETTYFKLQRELVGRGFLVSGKGRGGSVRLSKPEETSLTLEPQSIPAEAKAPRPQQQVLPVHGRRKPGEPTRPKRNTNDDAKVLAYRHADRAEQESRWTPNPVR